MMNKPVKSILKYKPETKSPPSTVTTAPIQQSWFSRLQSKLYNHPVPHDDDNPLLLAKQDLKRVTFSVGHLTTEYCFFADDSPQDESMDRQETSAKTEEWTTSKLADHYDHACIQSEEGCLQPFRAMLKQAKKMEDLKSINVSNQFISVHQAGPLSSVLMLKFGLTCLNVSNCRLQDEMVRILLSSLLVSNTIEQLNLSQNDTIKTKGFKYIAIFIKQSKTIQLLDISHCTIEKRAMEFLSQGLQHATSLSRLKMDTCLLKQTAGNVLVEGVCLNHSLISLSLRNIPQQQQQQSPITSWIPQLLANAIQLDQLDLSHNRTLAMNIITPSLIVNHTLTRLSLSHCQINSEGLIHLSNGLERNSHIKALDLSNNPLGRDSDEGILALKNVLLAHESRLDDINLSATQLESSSVIALAEALPENTTLNRLDLSQNPRIDMAGVLALSISIKMNHTLTFLDINIPPLDEELANLQNDIVAVCTTNMLQKVEMQKELSSTVSTLSSMTLEEEEALHLPVTELKSVTS
ncbi:MAG: hypothetical protein EXX96DRAFT_573622 [Benjaminiella poitrasii]|nr:MAG: hypothetical protein EXX96DRAFT_573622 [Benjaminiella poitrasii]